MENRAQRAVDKIVAALEQATAYIHTTVHRVESPWGPEDWRECTLGACGTTNHALRSAERIMAGYDR